MHEYARYVWANMEHMHILIHTYIYIYSIRSSSMANIMVIIMLNFMYTAKYRFVYQMQIERSNESVHRIVSMPKLNWSNEKIWIKERVALRSDWRVATSNNDHSDDSDGIGDNMRRKARLVLAASIYDFRLLRHLSFDA